MLRTLSIAVPCAVTTLHTDSWPVTCAMGLTALALAVRNLRTAL